MFDGVALIKYYNYLGNTEALIIEYIRKGFYDKKY
jgi:hypothetical protein